MKAYRLLIILVLCSCNLLDPDSGLGVSRWEENRGSGGSEDGDSSGSESDTLVYISGVSFPETYDWQRDTSYGAVGASLLLLRGQIVDGAVTGLKLMLDIPAGPGRHISADFDRHHIIGGHLYSECAETAGTSVGVDGQIEFSYPDREKLLGLYPDGADIWTLGRRETGGFSLRKNGVTVFSSGSGSAFGGFSRPGYGESGALYCDSGQICFCYGSTFGRTRNVYVVRDGVEKLVFSSNLNVPLDAKSVGGADVIVFNGSAGTSMQWGGKVFDIGSDGLMKWESGGIVDAAGEPVLAGTFRYINASYSMGGIGGRSGSYNLEHGTLAIRWSGGFSFGAGLLEGDSVFLLCRKPDALLHSGITVDEPCYLLSQSCTALADCNWYVALTPRNSKNRPFVIWRSDRVELDINGFLSGVSLEVRQSGG